MAKQSTGIREFVRKRLVSLKRKPQIIALIAFVVGFVYYSLNLTNISNTTAKIQGQGMGLAGFATMLFSILLLVCFLNAFPHRKKVNIPMLALLLILTGVVIYCDFFYEGLINEAVYREVNPISATGNNSYISRALTVLGVHRIIMFVGVALVALLPVYSKALRKINTSIEVADNGGMEAIDISGEDA